MAPPSAGGSNDSGQLGDGSLVERRRPTPVVGIRGVAEIAVGAQHACARMADGTVRCWGDERLVGLDPIHVVAW